MKKYSATPENVKMLGRYSITDSVTIFSFSATGVEFNVKGSTKCSFELTGDELAATESEKMHHPRIAIYVNSEMVLDKLLSKKEDTFEISLSCDCIVRLIKLSESSDSSFGIRSICVDDDAVISPTPAKDFKIEFIGDSITCGYGVDGTPADTYCTALENATKAFAYKTAAKLNCDYSLVSFSGFGIISGYTELDERLLTHILPDYYESIGHSYSKILGQYDVTDIKWDFSLYTPDLIVINLGTNDASYTKDIPERQEHYTKAYVNFLKKVRSLNPHSKILCVLGIMGRTLLFAMEKAAKTYSEETGDTAIYTMDFEEQGPGQVIDGHPTEATHEAAASKLADFIRTKIMS